ncbi:hypothetical protein PROAA_180012 [Candidatus Propionivibrio aalborgensis]|uniref:Uncharacterized protein n=1 Tax=Candidatus Propionivibrio aalborgensis TaxID=1860101 RepID=A0A1A8XLZ4_9RHOO|nr:hypothetical protein PROAA_180012 [Candidatus Propionivibrio aalborgensis]
MRQGFCSSASISRCDLVSDLSPGARFALYFLGKHLYNPRLVRQAPNASDCWGVAKLVKAPDFDSGIRRFESFFPSHSVFSSRAGSQPTCPYCFICSVLPTLRGCAIWPTTA